MGVEELLATPGTEVARGLFNDAVVLHGEWVARFPRHSLPDARRRARALRLISSLELPFAVPEVIEDRLDLPLGEAHVVISYVAGEQSETASDEAVREVLDALESVELSDELVALLDEPLLHAGGRSAAESISELVFPLLTEDERGQASQVLRRCAELPPARSFVHGDLAPVNLRWHNGKVSGIIDWDFACAGDPALDAAAFANYGWPVVRRARPELYERALTHAAMFPLTGAVSALLQGGDPARFLAWFRRRCSVREHPPLG
ncbi:aminoglycoside phosphotransferase family protein [Lentzea sp. JNUCC 0626]|uniref:aminoglycoside phosphotransferase family protein n=1 Tax=Lentzea sp. JNUCC 0626 TaxID=3367513 RepID=UPI00374A44F5